MLTQQLHYLEKIVSTQPGWGLAASFAAGVLVSFSPCVYPLIPITLSIVGAAHASSKAKGFVLSSVFVLGICVTYTALGITAALLGKLLGSFFMHPAAQLTLSVMFMFLGLCFLDIIKLNIFSLSFKYQRGQGLVPLFITGMISGLALIPCNYPVLGSLLSLIAAKRNALYGALALFLFSLGYGLLLIVLGTSTSLLRKLPRQGQWLMRVKKAGGVVLILAGIYFAYKFYEALQ